ncbi:NAD(P)-dependent alcohol dehydrogenase [Hymenobacter arizonensis]|uniref:NADPH:quinone reductase n=1 Tax=Hymenobacter arizonensis TaxID=1227077 RepID=A0A1I6AJ30_HYMAR|nr:NAD(P)-dependent alcohol dehydrogenase [Hymenobacter arizonensis]SFQ68690.1 NADPH:quinone reductase [Hymenobacter arizonensis]
MKKVIYKQFGGVEVLELAEVPQPALTPGAVLVRVKAVSLNPLDWKIRQGEMKLVAGSKFPKGVGIDFAGVVEAVGEAVSGFRPRDEVFGLMDVFKGGALAEYVVVPDADLVLKPANLSFAQAAALPVVGSAALQVFDQLVAVGPGTEILLNGASGGIGMVATQLARQRGAHVTAVVGLAGVAQARQWGSDVVLNYREHDVRHLGRRYDVVLDLSGKLSFHAARSLLKPTGTYINTVPGPREIVGSFLHNLVSQQKYRVLMLKPTPAYLRELAALAARGLNVVVSQTYPMADFQRAYAEVARGGVVGKAVLTVP